MVDDVVVQVHLEFKVSNVAFQMLFPLLTPFVILYRSENMIALTAFFEQSRSPSALFRQVVCMDEPRCLDWVDLKVRDLKHVMTILNLLLLEHVIYK